MGFILIFFVYANAQSFQKTDFGIRTTINQVDVEIAFLSARIVRIKKTVAGVNVSKESLSVIKQPEKCPLKINRKPEQIAVASAEIEVRLDTRSGKVGFFSPAGKPLLNEKENGTRFSPFTTAKEDSYRIQQAFILDNDEAIYGLGQQQNGKLMQRGQRIVLKNENMKICIPYFLSAKGYGVFWDNYAPTVFADSTHETSFESTGKCADYYFMYGKTGHGVVAQMRELTGQSPMLPLWAYGFWQSRERYKTQQELIEVVEKYRALNVPLDGIVQDWQYWGKDSVWNAMRFDSATFPHPQAMADKVHQLNAHLMVVAWPGFGPKTKQFADFQSKNMLIDFDTWPPRSGTKPYDLYNPAARDIYWDYLNKGVFSIGTDAWWLDSSEPDHLNAKEQDFDLPTHLGTYRSVVNAFPLMHTKGVYEHQRATTSAKRVCILTRSAFAGQQRYAANSWSGDVRASWETLSKQIPTALNFSLCGIPYWNADIGGFFASGYAKKGGAQNPEFQELYVRWAQFAGFTPMMRSHGTDIPREIYQFGNRGDWAFDAIEKSIRLRYQLLPYLYATAWEVTTRSGSFMNALPLEFSADSKVLNITDQYLFGRSFLVAPVIKPMYVSKADGKRIVSFDETKSRQVYLPKGADWFDFHTGEKFSGGQEIQRKAPIDLIPLYVRAGSIIPIGPRVQYATEKQWDNLEIRVYGGANGNFTLYEDENDNYNYEKGICSTISFTWDEASKTLTIHDRKGNFPGMLKERVFQIGSVNSSKSQLVTYSGKKIQLKIR